MKLNKLLCLLFGLCLSCLSSCSLEDYFGPIQEHQKELEIRAHIQEIFKDYVSSPDFMEEEVDIKEARCTRKFTVENEQFKGTAYICAVNSNNGDIEFIIAFGNGNYLSYTNIANNESESYGKRAISNIIEGIQKINIENDLLTSNEFKNLVLGCSVTGNAIGSAIEACRQDYLSWYYNT